MATLRRHAERHRTDRIGWLRAAVLGANDGIVSTASLLVGVAAAGASHGSIVLTGLSGLVAGAMSMAAGEYVSVHSQADTERADLAREAAELKASPKSEARELAGIYVQRGLDAPLADEVARQLMQHDALGAHARDELGITQALSARPLQAAGASAASFTVGAALPLGVAWVLSPERVGLGIGGQGLPIGVSLASLVCLAALGVASARTGGAPPLASAARVTFWGALAMAVTAGVGWAFGVAV